jgi:hypothetical protein
VRNDPPVVPLTGVSHPPVSFSFEPLRAYYDDYFLKPLTRNSFKLAAKHTFLRNASHRKKVDVKKWLRDCTERINVELERNKSL